MSEHRIIVSTEMMTVLGQLARYSEDRQTAMVELNGSLYAFPIESVVDVNGKSTANMLCPAGRA